MSECIYCGVSGKLTREHIIPSFICNYQSLIENDDKLYSWREKPQKIVNGEAKIKDVCEKCNNVILSRYDDHSKYVFEEAGIFKRNFLNKSVLLKYDYEKFSKWLLKVAYNSSRASGVQVEVFERFKKYIISESKYEHSDYFIACGILKPYNLTLDEFEKYGEGFGISSPGFINPFFTRVSWSVLGPEEFSVKQIVIGALVFHVCAFKNETTRVDRRRAKRSYQEKSKGMTILSKNSSSSHIKQLPYTFIDSLEPQMMRESFQQQLEKIYS